MSSRYDDESGFLRDIPGYIYIINQKDTFLFKIGRSQNYLKRFKQLQTSNPHELILIFAIWCVSANGVEKELHAHFSDKRVSGEWFELNREDFSWMESEFQTRIFEDEQP